MSFVIQMLHIFLHGVDFLLIPIETPTYLVDQSGGGRRRRSTVLHDACEGSWHLHCFKNK